MFAIKGRGAGGLAAALTVSTLAGLTAAPAGAGAVPSAVPADPVTSSSADAPTRVGPRVPTLRWRDHCFFGGFQCATARVPLDYDHPLGRQISLSLVRLRATDPARRIGTMFTNPGGPGVPGTDWLRGAAQSVYTKRLLARLDLIGFDPRGVARSTPVQCFPTNQAEAKLLEKAPVFPVTPNEERRTIAVDRAFARRCAERYPRLISHMSTANVARDMDLLRRAVGDRKLTFAGYSYGTFLGATYANMFPNRVRAIVADGVLDPVQWATGHDGTGSTVPFSTRLGSGASSAATMRHFLRACDRVGPRCEFSAGDPVWRWHHFLRLLHKTPLRTPDGEAITYAAVVSGILGLLYFQDAWPSLANQLREQYAQVVAAQGSRRAVLLRGAVAVNPFYNNDLDAFSAVACSDTDNPPGAAAWPRAADRAARRSGAFGRLWTWESGRCLAWRGHDGDRYPGPFTRRTANPILVVGNRWDPATPYAGARALNRVLARSRLLTVNYAGHTSLGQSRCASSYTESYLIRGTLPPRGTVCPSDRKPFEPPPGPEGRRSGSQVTPGPYAR